MKGLHPDTGQTQEEWLRDELLKLESENAKLQAVLKDIAYSGIHMTVGEIRERALDAIKEVEYEY